MAWTVFVTSLIFIVGIQATSPGRYPQPTCNGTDPWPLGNDVTDVDYKNIISSHVLKVKRSQNLAFFQLKKLADDWEELQPVTPPPNDRFCFNHITEDTQEEMANFTSNSRKKIVDLSEGVTKMDLIFSNYQTPTEDDSADRHVDITQTKKAYAAICKVSGVLADDFDKITRDIQSFEEYILQQIIPRCS